MFKQAPNNRARAVSSSNNPDTTKMKTTLSILAGLALASASALAAPKTYQVTGPVLEMTDTTIVVQKGKERWELTRDANTKITGDPKVGSKVTIDYSMSAATVTTKEDKKAAKSAASPADAAAMPAGSPAAKAMGAKK